MKYEQKLIDIGPLEEFSCIDENEFTFIDRITKEGWEIIEVLKYRDSGLIRGVVARREKQNFISYLKSKLEIFFR